MTGIKKVKYFIQDVVEHEKKAHHIGMTHKLLGVPRAYNLSHAETLLTDIVNTDIGNIVKNPLVIGKRSYKVTKKLKQHANLALNLIRISEGKGKRKK